ncbi:MAG: zinc ribbon domain-containing protein [Desulfobacterales bacterium]|nr:zinc ribbon domain-containing protein [Desulfobacterales bacterium]
MPIYEYTCKSCGKEFETLVMGSDKPACPGCESLELERLISKCGFVSKGFGPDGETTITASSSNSGCAGCSATNCGSCGVG